MLPFKELKTAERETTPRTSSHRESLNESTGSLDLEKSFHPRFDLSVQILLATSFIYFLVFTVHLDQVLFLITSFCNSTFILFFP